MELVNINNRLSAVLSEYEQKLKQISVTVLNVKSAVEKCENISSVSGTYGRPININVPYDLEKNMQKALKVSAWQHLYESFSFKDLMTAKERQDFERQIENPPEFTFENIFATFGEYARNPKMSILRGLAEVFVTLDDKYKSHSNVKIGVEKLPKRIIISNVNSYGYGYGFDKAVDVMKTINMLFYLYNGTKPDNRVYNKFRVDFEKVVKNQEIIDDIPILAEDSFCGGLGVSLKYHKNQNLHMIFQPETLRLINLGLAEFYGDVLPDCATEQEIKESTLPVKDLQFYPTPKEVAKTLIYKADIYSGIRVLEPSCGEGALLEVIRESVPNASIDGIEIDATRAKIAREKGFGVWCGNFLELQPKPDYDIVIMNPPFYGKHYQLHLKHAMKFLKDGGRLVSILPATAWYDHDIKAMMGGIWSDLPVGSFRESGTNINTGILIVKKR